MDGNWGLSAEARHFMLANRLKSLPLFETQGRARP